MCFYHTSLARKKLLLELYGTNAFSFPHGSIAIIYVAFNFLLTFGSPMVI